MRRFASGLRCGQETGSGSAPVLVVDRPGWIQANLDAFRLLLTPLTDKAAAKVSSSPRAMTLGSRVTGAEVGVLLSYLGPKVLGQFDPFWTGPDGAQGRRAGGAAVGVVHGHQM